VKNSNLFLGIYVHLYCIDDISCQFAVCCLRISTIYLASLAGVRRLDCFYRDSFHSLEGAFNSFFSSPQ
jgi:hypothetical protein